MRKFVLMASLAAMSSGAMAAWVEVGSNEITTIYVDQATIQRDGKLAKMWHLTDFKRVKKDIGEPYMSMKDQYEYDCKEEKMRRRASIQYSKNMGDGKKVYNDSYTTKWKPVPPDSGLEVLWKFACIKK